MNPHDVKTIVQYIQDNCKTTLSARQSQQLYDLTHMSEHDYTICKLRVLYRIAIDNFVYPECPQCHQAIKTQEDLTIDHIIPRAMGGSDEIKNLQPMHKTCNSDKGCSLPENTECPGPQLKKHQKAHNGSKHKEREIVKSRTPEELYKKCQNIDRARANKARNDRHRPGK